MHSDSCYDQPQRGRDSECACQSIVSDVPKPSVGESFQTRHGGESSQRDRYEPCWPSFRSRMMFHDPSRDQASAISKRPLAII